MRPSERVQPDDAKAFDKNLLRSEIEGSDSSDPYVPPRANNSHSGTGRPIAPSPHLTEQLDREKSGQSAKNQL